MDKIIKVGTRPSRLAIKQAEEIQQRLPHLRLEKVEIFTRGDLDKATPFSDIEGSNFFTQEIEAALLNGSIDAAVHSAKDLEEVMPEQLTIAAITTSMSPYECLVSRQTKKLDELPKGAKVGTSSLKRRDALIRYRPDLQICDIRGNIDERLRQLDEGRFDAVIMAHAALIRLGYENRISEIISVAIIPPHPLQGSLADLIRENFGIKITFFIFLGLIIADIGNTATEFAGVAGSMMVFGVSKYASVPLVALAVWILVTKGNYKIAERIFLLFSFCLLSYIVSAVLARPNWQQIGIAFIRPQMHLTKEYLSIVLGILGTTVAPWMQFYMQSAVMEKGLKIEEYKFVVWDVIIGCTATIVVAFFIIVACAATLHINGIVINEAKDAAVSLRPFAGAFASELFAFGLFVASVFSATILPLATAFYVCEAFGFEAGINKKIKEAPQFYILFAAILVIAITIILLPNAPLIAITIWSQVINAMLLPVVLISMILIINNKRIMGQYVNKNFQNIVGWSTTIILIVLTIMLVVPSIISPLLKLFK